MACGKTTGQIRKRLKTTTTTTAKEPFSDWILISDRAKITLVVVNVTGSIDCQAFVQYAAVRPDGPEAPIAKGSVQSNAGSLCTGTLDLSAETGGKMWMRVGCLYNLPVGGSGLGEAEVILEFSYDQCWTVVASGSMDIVAGSTTDAFAGLCAPLPALNAEKWKAAFVVSSVTGNAQSRLTYRKATASKDAMGAWQTTFDAWRGAGEANTTILTPSVSDDMWVQPGLQYALSSGSTPGTANVSYVLAVKRG